MQKNASSNFFALILLAGIVLSLAIVGVFIAREIRVDQFSALLRDNDNISILIMVHDDNELMTSQVLFVHPESFRIALLDVPDNLGAIIPRLNRVDSISVLFDRDRIQDYQSKIEDLTGTDINYYIAIDETGLSELIDLIGGLELFLPDPVQDYEQLVFLPAGRNSLDGSKVIDYLHFDSEYRSAHEAMSIYQVVIAGFLHGLAGQETIIRNNYQLIQSRMNKNLDRREFAAFASFMRTLEIDSLIQQRVLGTIRTVDIEGVGRELLFPHFEGQLLKDTVRQVQNTLAAGDAIARGEMIRVELLNGTTRTGLAARSREVIEGYGFQVVSVGNADSSDYPHTLVFDRQGAMEKTQAVADVINARRVESQPNHDTDVVTDVTIILGADFDGWKVHN